LAIDKNNIPYVAYINNDGSYKPVVQKFDGSSWINVGSLTSSSKWATAEYSISLAFDKNNTLYMAYMNGGDGNKVTIEKFNGTSWIPLGSVGSIVSSPVLYPSLVLEFDSNNTPYVAYSDTTFRGVVQKFDGTSWIAIGKDGFSSGRADSISLKFDSNNTPYVAYNDVAHGYKATVKKYDGNSWVNVGPVGFSTGKVFFTSVALDNNNTPYVAYRDDGNDYKATVKKFNGTSWVNVGTPSFSKGTAQYISLVIDSRNIPYIAYRDEGSGYKATVMKFNGTSWVNLGMAGFSEGATHYTSLVLDSNNIPYITYRDKGNEEKVTVMRFNRLTYRISTPENRMAVIDFNATNFDNDTLTFSISGIDSKFFDINSSTGMLSFKHAPDYENPKDHGLNNSYDIIVSVNDATTKNNQNFQVFVTNVNEVPIFAPIANQIAIEDSSELNIPLNVTDLDGDSISYTVTSSDTNIATVSIVNGKVVVTPIANANGMITVEVNATANGQTVTQTFDINVTAVDDAPYFTAQQGSYGVQEDATGYSVILTANDVENNAFTYHASAQNNKVTLTLVDNNLTITPNANANGDVVIDVNVTQDSNTSLYDAYNFTVSINPLNDTPTIDTTFNDVSILEDNGTTTYELNVSDIEGDDLNISVESNNTNILRITPNWTNRVNQATWNQPLDFNLTTVPNANGIVTINIKVTDEQGASSISSFKVNVIPVDDNITITTGKLTYPRGWSLKALPTTGTVNATTFSNVTSLWKYSNGKWTAYAPNSVDMQVIADAGIDTLRSVTATEGFWINATNTGSVDVNGSQYDITVAKDLSALTSGWYLFGNGTATAVATIAEKNQNINIMWTYSNDRWYAYSPDSTIVTMISDAGIETISSINASDGFWVLVK